MGTDELYMAVNEKDVENLYRHSFLTRFKDMEITSPFGCDGFGVSKKNNLRVLFEFKDDLNLQSKVEICKVLAQSVFYVKKFYGAGIIPPSTIFVGDRNECFTVHVNDIIDYLDMDLNWNQAPSSAHRIPELMARLTQDENIKPFIFDSAHFSQCVEKVKDLTDNVQRKVLVTDKNITVVFRYFDEKVLGPKCKLTTNDKANLFVQLLVNRDDNYLHPVKRRIMIVTKAFGEVPVTSRGAFESFFAHFASSYSPSQKDKLTAVVDRLVEDMTRRKQGEFFTPAIWVDKAHEYIASVYGDDWKEKYVVWDPAWGTGNLTRDYKFKELYVSTLNQSDIDTANQMGYNPEATNFQYDFLNDDYEKLPEGLRNAIEEGRQIIVLMNPPYARPASNGKNNKVEKGSADTNISDKMKTDGWSGTSNIQAQFFYRISKLSKGNINIGVFCKPNYLTSVSFNGFRNKFFESYSYDCGFLFKASHFADVSSVWGIHFAIYTNKKSTEKNVFTHDMLDLSDSLVIDSIGTKKVYNVDNGKTLSEYNKKLNPKGDSIEFPKFSSALRVKETNWGSDIKVGTFSTMVSNANNVAENANSVYIVNGGISKNVGKVFINDENILDVMVTFSSRKSINGDWINDKDEYLPPKEEHEQFEQFKYDSLIYSLFNNSSEQSSLRQVEYKGQMWDIKNEFFWMSKDRMKELADNNGYDNLYNDARTSSDRHVYNLLFGEERIYDKLSEEAKAVLDKATELVEQSFQMRQVMANDENHLDSWDAGYAQLKLVWKEYFPEQFNDFRQLYKNLEDRMRPLVYELGFLMK